MEYKIDISNFQIWKSDPVTKCLMRYLKTLKDDIEYDMLDPSIVLAEDGQIEYAKREGIRKGLDRVLEIEFNDLKVEDEDKNVENIDTSRA